MTLLHKFLNHKITKFEIYLYGLLFWIFIGYGMLCAIRLGAMFLLFLFQ